mgnify:FL=1
MAKYKVNEIFYSIQGEGRHAGRAAIFVRFSGCNLKCPFCDTDFKKYEELEASDIIDRIRKLSLNCNFVVLTGGEPTLQVDEHLITILHNYGYYIAMETNGTHNVSNNIDWITCSPKSLFVDNASVRINFANEVKVVYDSKHEITDCGIEAEYFYVQPCDVGDTKKNAEILKQTVDFVEANPKWRLSLQQQKILNVK